MLNNILIVENDPIDTMCMHRFLQKLGNRQIGVKFAANGEEGLKKLQDSYQEKPDLILLDLNMPRMSGLDFLAIVKNNTELTLIPIVILTTSSLKKDRIAAFALNAAGYMIKPTDLDNFQKTFYTIIEYWMLSEGAKES